MISANQALSASRKPPSGFSRTLNICLLLLLCWDSVGSLLYKHEISDTVLSEIFGSLDCIQGNLASIEMAPVTVQMSSNNVQDNQVTSSDHEITIKNLTDHSSVEGAMAKEKTPMCLVNELARFNKIEHQYRLTSEEGPPHKKRFTVTLKLGTEEYTADGPSIKKAQHSAAGKALADTAYRHPPPKVLRASRPGKGNLTPTVELNALAMKRGEPTVYNVLELPPVPRYNYIHSRGGIYTQPYSDQFCYSFAHNALSARGKTAFNRNGFLRKHQQGRFSVPGKNYKVTVTVGDREFTGEGVTAQAARHDAASRALRVLRELPIDGTPTQCEARGGPILDADSASELKSPISLVHEIALKRNLPVSFDVLSEKGPPHMRTFVTRCSVGEKFQTTGEGNGKKVSKKRAAEKMLEQLRTLPPMTTLETACSLSKVKRKTSQTKKKPRNLIKEVNAVHNSQEQKSESDAGDMNPISRLIHIQQAKREKEPVYTLKDEKGSLRRREFHMEVRVGEHTFVGKGANKKTAKKNAAEGMLQLLGFSSPVLDSQSLPKYQAKENVGGVAGRQLVPGLLLMNDAQGPHPPTAPKSGPTSVSLKATAAVAKEYLNSHATHSQEPDAERPAVRPTEQLRYLSEILNFKVQYADFPKGNHVEFLSLVTLSTDPPQVCHGNGPNTDISKEQAALSALRSLAEMGLDPIASKKTETTSLPTSLPNTTLANNRTSNELYMSLGGAISKDDNYVNGQ